MIFLLLFLSSKKVTDILRILKYSTDYSFLWVKEEIKSIIRTTWKSMTVTTNYIFDLMGYRQRVFVRKFIALNILLTKR